MLPFSLSLFSFSAAVITLLYYYPQCTAQYLLCRPKWLRQSSWTQIGGYSHNNILKLRGKKPRYLFTVTMLVS